MMVVKTVHDMHQCNTWLMKADNPGEPPFAIFIFPGMDKFAYGGVVGWRFLVVNKIMLPHFNGTIAGNGIYFNTAFDQYPCNFAADIFFGGCHDAVLVGHQPSLVVVKFNVFRKTGSHGWQIANIIGVK